jgi:hypothetical protein
LAASRHATKRNERSGERLARLRPGRELTVTELVEEYLKIHQAAPSTIEKLRWLLSESDSRLRRSVDRRSSTGGDLRLARHAAGRAPV